MPFQSDKPVTGPLALPKGFDLNPEPAESDSSVLGAAFRLENPVVSLFNGGRVDQSEPFDPEYRPYEDIQGTKYEQYSDRFVEVRNERQGTMVKSQIDREIEDRSALEAAGGWGMLAEMTAGLLSPSSLLPGGAVVKGAKGGISIGRTGMSVAAAGGIAVALDEIALQNSQETRTGTETAMSIGGGILLGGLLGGGVGALSRKAHMRASASAELLPQQVHDFDAALRSIGAAENAKDMELRREHLFQFFNSSQFRVENWLSDYVPEKVAKAVAAPLAALRPIVRSDPILRGILSENIAVRRAVAELVETPLQYKINEQGQTVIDGASVETVILRRRNTELAQSLNTMGRLYAEYVNDGPVSVIGRVTAPVSARYQNLMNEPQKLTGAQFREQVGMAAMSGDTHPIPQVARAAQDVRTHIFNKAKEDAIAVGIFDEDLQLKYAESYFMRVYNTEMIEAHRGDGSELDISRVLREEFARTRDEAQHRVDNDNTVDLIEADLFQVREAMRGAARALKKAYAKARDKRGRAEGAIKRENKVSKVTGALRRHFEARSKNLSEGLMDGEELAAFKDMLADARGLKQLEPTSLLGMIRAKGGIRDPRVKNVWRNKDWVSDGTRTDIEEIMDSAAFTLRRNDGLEVDHMRELLIEDGYLPEGATIDDLLEAIRTEHNGDKIYSSLDVNEDVARYQAAKEFADALAEMDIDPAWPIEKIIQKIPGNAKSQKITKAKAGEAARSGRKADAAGGDGTTLMRAIDRLQEAKARLDELNDVIEPKVREEIKQGRKEAADLVKKLQDAKKAMSRDEFYASKDDLEIQAAVDDAINSILGLKAGDHSYRATMSSPTKARVLDVADKVLAPWLEKDMGVIMGQYFNSIIPDIEMHRRFGDLEMTELKRKITDEGTRLANAAKTVSERKRHQQEVRDRIRELDAMRDRIRGTFGVPDDPKGAWVRGSRVLRTLSYTGYLGGMTLSAIPDVANVIGRNAIEAAFGAITALTDPKRLGLAAKDAGELGAAAEWFLNSRAIAIADVMDDYGVNSKFERGLAAAGTAFGTATGMVPWNAGWKMVGAAMISSKMSKAAVAVKAGKATKKDMIKLAENGIDTVMAQRIADQVERFADRDGVLWLPQGRLWDDAEAFDAFRNAMNRETSIMIVTPGQDKPIAWSTETGKFFSQFKSFAVSAHHRITLSALQRLDAEVLAQFTMAVVLGGLVSNIKSDLGGYERKKGAAFWEDAIDKSGLSGWLLEAHGLANGFAGGRLSISGEETSRFASRSAANGLLGPSVDMGLGFYEGVSAGVRGEMTARDARKVLRPVPGTNLPYVVGLTNSVAEAIKDIANE